MGQKQSGSSYMARGVLHPIFGCPSIFAKPVDFEFPREKVRTKVGRTAGGVTSLEGQLSSARTSDLFTRVLSSQWRKQLPRAFRAGPPRTNSHSCNQTRLDSGDSQ